MQDHRNTKVRNIAERFAPSPSRREMLAGAAVAVIGLGAAAVDTEATAGQDGAAALAEQWADATRAMLKAERDAGKASDAADKETFALHYPSKEKPKAPAVLDFAPGHKARTEEAARQWVREIVKQDEAAKAEAEKNPAYKKALADYEAQLAEWEAMNAKRREADREAEERHGVPQAEQTATERTRAFWKAQEAIFRAPINSEKDAIAVLCAMMFAADQAHGFFDVVNGEGHDEAFKPEIADTLERLKPFLPGSPVSLQKHWNI